VIAAEVIAGLQHRWPDSEYLSIREAPQDSMRQGRKLDLLVVSLWSSRGHELDGVEVKVSIADWRKELKEAAKADWWYHRVHRFWIAVPEEICDKVREDLPPTWGLISVREAGAGGAAASVIRVKAPKHDALPFSWNTTIGLLRAGADAGPRALAFARQQGETLGRTQAKAEFERGTASGQAQRQLEALRTAVREFEAASGIQLTSWANARGGTMVGEAAKMALDWSGNPTSARRNVASAISNLERSIADLRASDEVFAALEAC
jgi:hypothetical protein